MINEKTFKKAIEKSKEYSKENCPEINKVFNLFKNAYYQLHLEYINLQKELNERKH